MIILPNGSQEKYRPFYNSEKTWNSKSPIPFYLYQELTNQPDKVVNGEHVGKKGDSKLIYPGWGGRYKGYKGRPLLVCGTSGTNQSTVVAEWDDGGLLRLGMSANELEQYLKEKYPKELLLKSYTGRPKIIFVISGFQSGIKKLDARLATQALQQLLESKLFEAIDTLGMCSHFIMPDHTYLLYNKLRISPVHEIKFKTDEPSTCIPVFTATHSSTSKELNKYTGDLPTWSQAFLKGKASKFKSAQQMQREGFLRILLATVGLVEDGFNLPTTFISKQLGIHQRAVWNWRQELVELGWLECIWEASKGYRAARYVAKGQLLEELISLRDQRLLKSKFVPITEFKPGETTKPIWDMAIRLFYSDPDWEAKFWEWFYSVKGHDEPGTNGDDRAHKIKDAIKKLKKKPEPNRRQKAG